MTLQHWGSGWRSSPPLSHILPHWSPLSFALHTSHYSICTVLCIIIETLKRENPVACMPKRGIHTRYVTRCSHAFPPQGRDGEHIHSVLTTGNCAVVWIMRTEFVLNVFIGQPDSELLSNSMKVSRGGIIMKSHCCDADTYNRKVGLFLRNARVSFIMQSTVSPRDAQLGYMHSHLTSGFGFALTTVTELRSTVTAFRQIFG